MAKTATTTTMTDTLEDSFGPFEPISPSERARYTSELASLNPALASLMGASSQAAAA